MAEKIARLIGVRRPGKPAPVSTRRVDLSHPVLFAHRARLSPEQAQRLGAFALQFLH
ncbi:MAG TPA: hypothetical protein VK009_29495 [Chloroflexota bacterium]|nr:hypothetical protein [Chloroflexota bacterium]